MKYLMEDANFIQENLKAMKFQDVLGVKIHSLDLN